MSISMLVKGKYLPSEKAKEEMVKVESPIVHLVMYSGSQSVAHKDITRKYHPRRQPGRCAICGSTCHYTSQCTRPVKPKAKNAKWDDAAWQQEEVEWQEHSWETEEYEASKSKKGKGKRSKSNGKSKGRGTPRSTTPRPSQSQPSRNDRAQPKAKPEARSCATNDFLFAMMSTKSTPKTDHGLEKCGFL